MKRNSELLYPIPRIKARGRYVRLFLSDTLPLPGELALKLVYDVYGGKTYAVLKAHAKIGDSPTVGEALRCEFEDGRVNLIIPGYESKLPGLEWIRVYDKNDEIPYVVFKIMCLIG